LKLVSKPEFFQADPTPCHPRMEERTFVETSSLGESTTTSPSESTTTSHEPTKDALAAHRRKKFLSHLLLQSYLKVLQESPSTGTHPSFLAWVSSASQQQQLIQPSRVEVLEDVFKTMPYKDAVVTELDNLMQEHAGTYDMLVQAEMATRKISRVSV
jgi:hypothetical protein